MVQSGGGWIGEEEDSQVKWSWRRARIARAGLARCGAGRVRAARVKHEMGCGGEASTSSVWDGLAG